jgi:hypothetical protein
LPYKNSRLCVVTFIKNNWRCFGREINWDS